MVGLWPSVDRFGHERDREVFGHRVHIARGLDQAHVALDGALLGGDDSPAANARVAPPREGEQRGFGELANSTPAMDAGLDDAARSAVDAAGGSRGRAPRT